MQGGVTLETVYGIAFEPGLVEEHVNDLVVAARGGFVVEMAAHDGGGGVEEGCDFVVGFGGEGFGEEVGVVAPAGFDEEFLRGGALGR